MPALELLVAIDEDFACRSAACRPPTSGGTGGSLKAVALPDVSIGQVRMAYRPRHPDGHPDPGEIVWARVPFEDDPKQSKDRPVLIIGRATNGNLVGVQLTSKSHHKGSIPMEWGEGNRSWLKPDRLIQVDKSNYRKEGAYVKKPLFQDIADSISKRHGAPKQDFALLTEAFACRDKSCAPPPVGSGGSKPGTTIDAASSPHYKRRTAGDVGAMKEAEALQLVRDKDATGRRVLGKGVEVVEGRPVGVRANLNLKKTTGVTVQTLHDGTDAQLRARTGLFSGEAIGYGAAVALTSVNFSVNQRARFQIATGQANKFPMASVDGRYAKQGGDDRFDGVEIRFNPMRQHLFSDPDGRPIRSAEFATVVGSSVFVRGKITYWDDESMPQPFGEIPSSVAASAGADFDWVKFEAASTPDMVAEFFGYNPRQPRAKDGKWSAGGRLGSSSVSRADLDSSEWVDTAKMNMRYAGAGWSESLRAGVADVDWDSVPVQPLPKGAKLVATEEAVRTKYIKRVLDGEPLREGYEPQLVKIGENEFFIADGHHRMAMHSALGNPNEGLKVRIYEPPVTASIRRAVSLAFGYDQRQPRDREGQWTAHKRTITSLSVDSIERAHGKGVGGIFGESAEVSPNPWPRASRRKGERPFDPELVAAALRKPPLLEKIDPRILRSTQPSVVRSHVEYYLGSEYKRSGKTAADRDQPANRFPVIYVNRRGEHIILSGHHRAAAALVKGEDLDAIVVREEGT